MHLLKRGTLAAIVATTAMSGIAPAATPRRLPFPQCQPLCKGGPAHGPRVTAIFVHAQNGAQPVLVVDAYLAGFRPLPLRLALLRAHAPAGVGAGLLRRSRTPAEGRTRNHTWHLHFNVPVYTRGYLNGKASDVLLRRYWVAVAAGATPYVLAGVGGAEKGRSAVCRTSERAVNGASSKGRCE